MLFSEYKFLLPEISMIIILIINFIILLFQDKDKPFLSASLSCATLLLCPLFIFYSLLPSIASTSNISLYFEELYLVTKWNLIIKGFLMISIGFVHLFVAMIPKKSSHINSFCFSEIPILMNLALLGMICAVSSNNFIILYLALELAALPTYVLVAIKRDQMKSAEGALKYFVLGVMASSVFLYGISLVYMHVGSLSYADVITLLSSGSYGFSPLMMTGIILIFCGLFFKLAAAPFHAWIADVYQGTHNIMVAFIAVAPKLMAIFVIFILYHNVFEFYQPHTLKLISMTILLSLIFGTITAVKQKNFKRFLAYSGVASSGFLLLAVLGTKDEAFKAMIIYSFSYMIAFYGLITFVMFYWEESEQLTSTSSNDLNILGDHNLGSPNLIAHMHGLARQFPILGISISFCLFSMAGIPPFIGFIGKLQVLFSGLSTGGYKVLVFLTLLASIISLVYYLSILKVIYFENYTHLDKKHFGQYKSISIFFGLSTLFASLLFIFKLFLV